MSVPDEEKRDDGLEEEIREQRKLWAVEEDVVRRLAKCAGVYRRALEYEGFTAEQAFDLTWLWLKQRAR